MSSLGCPRYRPLGRMNWAPVLGLCQEPGRFTGPDCKSSFNPASWAWGVGLRAYFFKPNQKKNELLYKQTLLLISYIYDGQ